MASPYSILASVEGSNLPSREKSSIRRWMENLSDVGRMAQVGSVAHAGMHAVRTSGESVVVGGLLGAAHSELKTGLDVKKVPMDGVAGLVAAIASVAVADGPDGVSADARNVAGSCFSVLSFRKTYDLLAEKRMAAGKAPGGTFGPAQAARVSGEIDEDGGFDQTVYNDSPDDADGYEGRDGIIDETLTSEDELEDDVGGSSFGEDPILAVARQL